MIGSSRLATDSIGSTTTAGVSGVPPTLTDETSLVEACTAELADQRPKKNAPTTNTHRTPAKSWGEMSGRPPLAAPLIEEAGALGIPEEVASSVEELVSYDEAKASNMFFWRGVTRLCASGCCDG